MGACSSLCWQPAQVNLALGPVPAEVDLEDGAAPQKLGIISASFCYCLFAAAGDGAVFIDARPKEEFNRSHVTGAWSLEHLTSKTGGLGDTETAALRARLDLRWAVVLGSAAKPRTDQRVIKVLVLLRQAGIRPTSGQPLILRGGVPEFQRRFSFCMQSASENQIDSPACPAEILQPHWGAKSKFQRPHALYLGSLSCCRQVKAGKRQHPLAALGISVAVRLIPSVAQSDASENVQDLYQGLRFHNVQIEGLRSAAGSERPVAPAAGATLQSQVASEFKQKVRAAVAASSEACALVMQQPTPCLLCGPWSSLTAALCLSKVLPATHTAEELGALVKQRFPSADFDAVALAALSEVTGQHHAGDLRDAAGNQTGPLQPSALPKATLEAEMLCQQIRQRLKDRPKVAEVALGTTRTALEKVLAQPREERFRRLKASNERVTKEIMPNPEVVALLKLAGFGQDSTGDLLLPAAAPLQALRDVLAGIPKAKPV
mmetsp:Transcript_35833/g.65061  ORF Transcript_35833/g.65061 Transcript_35833/m.65061 type:complete len:489 (-) Transcript_35833:41-1507(-)